MIIKLFCWWFKSQGWKTGDNIPKNVEKCVVIGAPHTSNWDFVFALAAFKFFDLNLNYLAKKELFWWPLSILLKRTGAISIERSKSNNAVEDFIEEFKKKEKMVLVFPAEGTRKAVAKWKTGFYHVALGANVPVYLGYLDYKNKIAGFGNAIHLSGDIEKDFKIIKAFYEGIEPKNPNSFNIEGIRPALPKK
jgi:1-acyl-sn-glycerol-3-phosphate acyltransferase